MTKQLSFCLFLVSFFVISCKKDDDCGGSTGTVTTTVVLKSTEDAGIVFKADAPTNADANYNNVPEVPAFAWTVSGSQVLGRFLISFPLDTIPAGSQILSAKLYLFGYSDNYPSVTIPQGNSGDNVLLMQRATEPWQEATVTWNNQPASTTTDQIELPASTSTWNYNILEADVTTLVNQCYTSGNYGFLFKLKTEQTYRSIGFFSGEYSVVSKRPMLLVTYKR